MTTTTTAATLRRAHSVDVPPALRSRRRHVTRWALGRGLPLHRDALAAVVGARWSQTGTTPLEGRPERWAAEEVGVLLWVGIAEWCQEQGADLPGPDEVQPTLLTYLRFLSAQRLLERGSDPVAALRRAVGEYGGGRSAAHPAVSSRRPAPVVPIA